MGRVHRTVTARRAALEEELSRFEQAESALLDGLATGALWLEEAEESEQGDAAPAAKEEP